jgi:three-Cys-motif partner protein
MEDEAPWEEIPLFPAGDFDHDPPAQGRPAQFPLWTQNKARLVARYLFLFVQVTKRGTYIDGFAGPQDPEQPDLWTAKLVLESRNHEPWLRMHHLFEIDKTKLVQLEELRQAYPQRVSLHPVDFNVGVGDILTEGHLAANVPAFCLLDQHTFECSWDTVRLLAGYKEPFRIEQFYFLAAGWFGRAVAALKDRGETLRRWWGRDDVDTFVRLGPLDRALVLARRFREELGYTYAHPFAIYEKLHGRGHVMYYMIHASDHPEAIPFMSRAYAHVVRPAVQGIQDELFPGA